MLQTLSVPSMLGAQVTVALLASWICCRQHEIPFNRFVTFRGTVDTPLNRDCSSPLSNHGKRLFETSGKSGARDRT
ncbi:MAG TPA: hypothetical protein PKW12_10105 [Verrucomicrobiota bacterium]|nr:hypothetical protein [Verrucomicrobiota bacterium]